VITGAGSVALHPQRMRLAGRPAGGLFDRLAETQLRLARGEDGTGKPMSCTQAELRRIAEAQPSTLSELDRVASLGPQKLDRFGPAFLAVLRDG
jgi:ATP-dependent DNA helicase RecQ